MEPNPYESSRVATPASKKNYAVLWRWLAVVSKCVGGGVLVGLAVATLGNVLFTLLQTACFPSFVDLGDVAVAGAGFGAVFGWTAGLCQIAYHWTHR